MTRMNVILGTMTFGTAEGSRIHDLATIGNIIDLFGKAGYTELDTARMYCQGTTEAVLSELQVTQKFKIATKVYPIQLGDHQPEKLKATFKKSLETLKMDRVDIFYLHAPDHGTPIKDTLAAVQELYKEGRFERFGLSNYSAWQVSAICEIMESSGWVRPSVYQGMYNALTRDVERELVPCLRHYNIQFNIYNPLAGGLLSPNYKNVNMDVAQGSRFDESQPLGVMYRNRYWNQQYFEALSRVHEACEQEGLNPSDVALRWLVHHSKLDAERGDGIIIGTSSIDHTVKNLEAVTQGPLPSSILEALDSAWEKAMVKCPPYFR